MKVTRPYALLYYRALTYGEHEINRSCDLLRIADRAENTAMLDEVVLGVDPKLTAHRRAIAKAVRSGVNATTMLTCNYQHLQELYGSMEIPPHPQRLCWGHTLTDEEPEDGDAAERATTGGVRGKSKKRPVPQYLMAGAGEVQSRSERQGSDPQGTGPAQGPEASDYSVPMTFQ